MLADKRSAGVTPEVNLMEYVIQTSAKSVKKAAHSGFETQRRHHHKSKTGVTVAPHEGLMSSKNFKKKNPPKIKKKNVLLWYAYLSYWENLTYINKCRVF